MKRVSNYSLFFGVVVGHTTTLFQIFTRVKFSSLLSVQGYHRSCQISTALDVHELRAAPAAGPVKFPAATNYELRPVAYGRT